MKARLLQKMRECATLHQVPRDYRASQYDHTWTVILKKLVDPQPTFNLSDETLVQRDRHLLFLLDCYDSSTNSI